MTKEDQFDKTANSLVAEFKLGYVSDYARLAENIAKLMLDAWKAAQEQIKTCEHCKEYGFDELGLEVHLENYCMGDQSPN